MMRAAVVGAAAYLVGFWFAFTTLLLYSSLVGCGGRGQRCEPPRATDTGASRSPVTCEVRR